jgi:hypothetical protein
LRIDWQPLPRTRLTVPAEAPVFGIDRCAIVGVYCSGMFMYRNEAVPVREVDAFVAD